MSDNRVIVVYRLHTPPAAGAHRARLLALEQSIEMPAESVLDRRVIDEVAARVERLEPEADGTCLAHVALSAESIGDDAGQLLNMLFGNSSLLPDVEVLDIEVPPALARVFRGPGHGVDGVRRLIGAHGRPFTCTALKPIGSTAAHLAALCTTFAQAGIDMIKDDHGWADQQSAPFNVRVSICQRAVDEVNATRRDGTRTLYAPSLFGHHGQMQRQIEVARRHGVRAVLIAPMVCGVATLNALRREHADLVIMAHPSLGGASRIAPPALLGKLFRLFGADAVIFPNHGGRFTYARAVCDDIVRAARAVWHDLMPALPVPAGGMSVERVPELKREYGNDSMLLIGGSLLIARENLLARSRAFVDSVAAVDTVAA